MNAAEKIEYLENRMQYDPVVNAAAFAVIRTMGKLYPFDAHIKAYLRKRRESGDDFFDYYCLLWHIGAVFNPRRIMEIGCRTGLSLCELLSSMSDLRGKEIVLFDCFWGESFEEEDNRKIDEFIVKDSLSYLNLPYDGLKFVIGYSPKIILNYREENPNSQFDYILVNGGHDYITARADMDHSAALVADGGLILMDDIASKGGTPGRTLSDVWNTFKRKYADDFLFAENFFWKGVGVAVKREAAR